MRDSTTLECLQSASTRKARLVAAIACCIVEAVKVATAPESKVYRVAESGVFKCALDVSALVLILIASPKDKA